MGIDLWTPIIDVERLHPTFKNFCRGASLECFDVVNNWAEGFIDRDGKFIQEFQLTFNPCFWELYLFACFRELGYRISFANPSPDFELRLGPESLIAEATIASHAKGYRPEWDKQGILQSNRTDLHEAIRYTTLRLSNAISSKAKKYLGNYQKLTHVKERPFIICVAPFDSPFCFGWAQIAVRSLLFGMIDPIVEVDSKGHPICIGQSEAMSITKSFGVEVPLGIFRDHSYSHVSAIIFSSLASFSKVRAISRGLETGTIFYGKRFNALNPAQLTFSSRKPEYREHLLDGLLVFVNPYADYPLNTIPFHRAEIAFESWDIQSDRPIRFYPHEWLISRRSCTKKVASDTRKAIIEPLNDYSAPDRPKWNDRELRKANAEIIGWRSIHLAHVADWTVVVFQCDIDLTWHAMGVHQIVYALPAFRDANKDDSVESVAALDDHTTREEAFGHICQLVDESSTR